jgi:hypothetical protein
VGQCRGTVSKLRDTLNMFNPLYPAVRAPRRDALQRATLHRRHARNIMRCAHAPPVCRRRLAPADGGAPVF